MREVAERFRHMLKVKDCRHLCLTCEYYEICKREVNADEYEIRKYYKALYDQAGNSIAVPIFESIFRKIILHEVA